MMTETLFTVPFFGVAMTGWKLLGSIGALMFAMRWIVQAYYSRLAGKPVTPLTFWVMSLIGSNMQLVYFIFSPKQDMVGVLANFLPSFVAAYNLYLEMKNRHKAALEKLAAQKKESAPVSIPRIGSVRVQESAAGE